jgi:Putative prokaryotic signal transducing protein
VTVRLKIAVDETEAEVVCGLLRSEGIRCFHRPTDLTAHVAIQGPVGWREVLVNEEDLLRARELVDAVADPVDECARCGRELGEDGGWYPDDAGDLHPYCGVCAERLFGPYGLAS